jgi:hypothetical protein
VLWLLTKIVYPDLGKFCSKPLVKAATVGVTTFTGYNAFESGHRRKLYCVE